LLEQQVERLTPAEQAVVAAASVVGGEFTVAAVAASCEASIDEIDAHCATLARHGQFLQASGEARWPDGTVTGRYRFAHALYQDVIYHRLPVAQRIRLHQQIGRRLEAGYGSQGREIAAELAVHFMHGQETARAVRYLWQAAENAARRFAPYDMIDLVQRALALLATLPESPARLQQELDLHLALGPALITTRGFAAPEVEQTYARARALCTQVGETPRLCPTLRGLAAFYQTRGALPMARVLGEQLEQVAQRTAVPESRLEAHDALGSTLFFLGDYPAARRHLEHGRALATTAVQRAVSLRYDQAPEVRCLALMANTLWCLGYPAQAAERSAEALALAQALTHPHTLAFAQHHAAFLQYRCRDVQAVQMQAEHLQHLATAQGFPLYQGFGTCWQGWALAMQGRGGDGLALLREGMATVLATGQTLSRPLCLVLLAEAAEYVGQVEEGLHLLTEALAALEASARGDGLAETYRLQGTWLLRQASPDTAQAEACFQQALTVARRQQARSWELRAAMGLSRLWQQQGKCTAAYDLLAPMYHSFSEGFDTADLQDARALLDALS
jgi:predicted ATPase